MSLFDGYDGEQEVDKRDKNRLFETLKKEDRSAHDYLKVLLPVYWRSSLLAGGSSIRSSRRR